MANSWSTSCSRIVILCLLDHFVAKRVLLVPPKSYTRCGRGAPDSLVGAPRFAGRGQDPAPDATISQKWRASGLGRLTGGLGFEAVVMKLVESQLLALPVMLAVAAVFWLLPCDAHLRWRSNDKQHRSAWSVDRQRPWDTIGGENTRGGNWREIREGR